MTDPVDQSFQIHNNDDVDSRPEAHHHTTGLAPYQHSQGDHTHDGINSLPVAQGSAGVGGINPTGTVLQWAGRETNVPAGYLYCNGQAVSKTTYAALYAVIGDDYLATPSGAPAPAAGNFRLPDFTGRAPFGMKSGDANFNSAGAFGGAVANNISHTHGVGQHSHVLNDNGAASIYIQAASPSVIMRRTSAVGSPTWNASHQASFATAPVTGSGAQTLGTGLYGFTGNNTGAEPTNSGGSTTANNVPPFMTINFMIKT